MRVTMLALGSYGDVLPVLALGRRLVERGHRVRVATFASFGDLARRRYELEFWPVHGDAQALLLGSGSALAGAGRNVLRMWRAVRRSFGALAGEYARAFSAPALREADLIVNQLPGGLYGYDLAEASGVPMVEVAVMPLVRTRSIPMMAFPTWPSFLPFYNWCTYLVAEQLVWQWFRPTINRWRREVLGLDPQPFLGRFGVLGTERVPVVNAFSHYVVPRPTDWGVHVYVTGYWFPEEEWDPPEEVVRFVERGPAPVFVGFGSMPVRDPTWLVGLILEALRRVGLRAVLQRGWAGLDLRPGELERGRVMVVDYVPYGWLFSRMAAVVHHGGSGTTAFGLRAGVPSVLVPFLFDQFYWGERVKALGVGPAPVPFRRLTVDRLADALRIAVEDTEMRRRAMVLGERIRAEDGLEEAVRILMQIVGR